MKFKLRDYQVDAIKDCDEFINSKSTRKSLAILPCAAGKSLVIAEVANKIKTPVVVLQPNAVLLQQNYNKLIDIGGEASIYSASLHTKEISHLTYATIGSIKKDWEELKRKKVQHLIIDEAHYFTKSGSQIGKFIKQVGIKKVLGFTATPLELKRYLDGQTKLIIQTRSNQNIFNDIIHVTQIDRLVKNKFWSPLDYKQVDVDTSMLEYNSTGTEFTEYSINRFYDKNNLDSKIIATLHQLMEDGHNSILVAVPTVDTAHRLSMMLPEHSTVVTSEVKKIGDAFKNNLEAFNSGEKKIMFQVRMLTTGYDRPDLEVVVDACPTNSFTTYYQLLGRAVRIADGKEKGVIIDISGNYARFGKLEDITFKKVEGYGWGMFNKGVLMSDVDITADAKEKQQEVFEKRKKERVTEAVLPYGKYKFRKLASVPCEYLEWCYNEWNFDKFGNLKEEIKKVLIEKGCSDTH